MRAGLLSLAELAITDFLLAPANVAVAHAAAHGGPFRYTLIRP